MEEPVEEIQSVQTRKAIEYLNLMLYKIFNPYIQVGLLFVALIEAIAAPFCGTKLAISAIATAAVNIGLTLTLAGYELELIGAWAQRIHEGIVALHDEELRKLRDGQRPPAPEGPRSFFKN
jgi:hypothetical protein